MLKEVGDSVELIEKYLSSQKYIKVSKYLRGMFPEDIAQISRHLDKEYLSSFINIIRLLPEITDIAKEMEPSIVIELIRTLTASQIGKLFTELDPDDSASIISILPADLETLVFDNMDKENTEEAETLLQFQDEEAGRIMSVNYFSMLENATVMDAFKALKRAQEFETVYYIYIVDSRNHLIGVCSLRDLLTKPNDSTMKEIMNSTVISVPGKMDQEDVAKIVERYNLGAVPVVNHNNQLIGIVTVDDVIDIIRSEATEDIMKLAGTTEKEFGVQSPLKGFLRRMPWLLVSFFGGILTIQVNIFFLHKIQQAELWAFVTIIAGMGGNIASQSSTIVVRGLATGRILTTELWDVLWREVSIGVLLGVFFGIMLGLSASIQFYSVSMVGLSVAIGMLISMLIAATVGSLMPIIFQRINVDPAVATGPFVSTTIDNLGLVGYFTSTILIIKYLT